MGHRNTYFTFYLAVFIIVLSVILFFIQLAFFLHHTYFYTSTSFKLIYEPAIIILAFFITFFIQRKYKKIRLFKNIWLFLILVLFTFESIKQLGFFFFQTSNEEIYLEHIDTLRMKTLHNLDSLIQHGSEAEKYQYKEMKDNYMANFERSQNTPLLSSLKTIMYSLMIYMPLSALLAYILRYEVRKK